MDPFRSQFAANLNDICDRMGLPKQGVGRATELARLFGICIPSAHKWLTGGSLPDLDKLPRICTLLKCTSDELVLGLRSADMLRGLLVRIPMELKHVGIKAEMTLPSECLLPFGYGPFRILEVVSNEMEPYVMEGDFVFYDTSFSSLDRNGVYVIEHRGNKFVRRVQTSMNGHISLLCDSALFTTENLNIDSNKLGKRDDSQDFVPLGRVLARLLVKR